MDRSTTLSGPFKKKGQKVAFKKNHFQNLLMIERNDPNQWQIAFTNRHTSHKCIFSKNRKLHGVKKERKLWLVHLTI